MLQEIRKNTKQFWSSILLAMLIMSFALWGVGDMVSHSGQNPTMATVGGEKITYSKFAREFALEKERFHRSLGSNYSPELMKKMQLERRVLQRMIDESLIRQEAAARGIRADDTAALRRIRTSPEFIDLQGNFDRVRFNEILRASGKNEAAYLEEVKQDIAVNVLLDSVLTAISPPNIMVESIANMRDEQRNVQLYTVDPAKMSVSRAPDDATIETYYSEHSEPFRVPEYRRISYVTFDAKKIPVPKLDDEALQTAYHERLEEFKLPELRETYQLLFTTEDDAKAAASKLASGESFSKVARASNASNKENAALGLIAKDKLPTETAEQVFALSEGGATSPIKTGFGWHVFFVSHIQAPTTLTFAQAKPTLEKEMLATRGEEALNHFAHQLQDALAGGATLAETAKQFNLELNTLPLVTAEGVGKEGKPLAGIPQAPNFLKTVFSLEERADSGLISTPEGGLIAYVEEVQPAHTHPLAEVKQQVIEAWKRDEAVSKARAIATEAAATLRSGDNTALAKLTPGDTGTLSRNKPKIGALTLPPDLAYDVFRIAPGQFSGAYQLADGRFALVKLLTIVKQDSAANKMDAATHQSLVEALTHSLQNEAMEAYALTLQREFSVHYNDKAIANVIKATDE